VKLSVPPGDVDPQHIIELCLNKTNIQIEGIIAQFIGKTINIVGRVIGTWNYLEYCIVDVSCGDRKYDVESRFSLEAKNTVAHISQDTIISISGKLLWASSRNIRLQSCSIIDILPP
jgi:hypothetical protein